MADAWSHGGALTRGHMDGHSTWRGGESIGAAGVQQLWDTRPCSIVDWQAGVNKNKVVDDWTVDGRSMAMVDVAGSSGRSLLYDER